MRFKTLDLNLLVALDALLDEQSVTRAAERVHVSQPAMSAALARLREHLNEPLFVQHGKTMIPTAAALRMKEPLKELLQSIDILVTQGSHFDPATSHRRFRIATSDYLLAVLFPALIHRLDREAPGIGMDCIQPSELTHALLDQGALDLFIGPEELVSPEHPTELLIKEKYVVVGWSKNPVFKQGSISAEDFYEAGHVVVEIGRQARTSFAEAHLQQSNRKRRIDMRVSSFLIAPEMVVNTMKLTVMHERLAKMFANRLEIAISALPFEFPVMREMIQYQHSRQNDDGLRWLIDQLKQAG
ncbi:MAG: LysR family transcriptional regulator [Halioglobus sp.]